MQKTPLIRLPSAQIAVAVIEGQANVNVLMDLLEMLVKERLARTNALDMANAAPSAIFHCMKAMVTITPIGIAIQ